MDPGERSTNPVSRGRTRAQIHDERLYEQAEARRLVKEGHEEDVEYNGARPSAFERLRAVLRRGR